MVANYGGNRTMVQFTIALSAQDYMAIAMNEMSLLEEAQKNEDIFEHTREHLVENLQVVIGGMGINPDMVDEVVGLVYAAVSHHYPFKQRFLM